MTSVDDNESVQIVPDPDRLYVYHRQQLSAMLDGELSPDEAKFMLRRLQHDHELAACWERWQVCGDVLRGQRNDLLPADFAQRVARAVGAGGAGEVRPAQHRPAARPRLVRWGGGAAVAASVALMAVFASRQLPDAAPAATPAPMVAEAAPAASERSAPVVDAPAPAVAVADAGPAAPAPVGQPDPSTALAAAAVAAAADTPRRAAQRRARNQARPAVESAPAPVVAVAANDAAPSAVLPGSSIEPGAAFPMPPAVSRPWPRALLAPQGGFNVANGGLLPREPQFEPLLPGARLAPWAAPATAEPDPALALP